MASTDKPSDTEYGKEVTQPQPVPPSIETSWFKVDVALRVLLFAATVTSLVVLVTSKQTIHEESGLSEWSIAVRRAARKITKEFIGDIHALQRIS